MSELTLCNYCKLRRIQASCEPDKKIRLQGNTAYRVPIGFAGRIREDSPEHDEYFVAWFMDITDHCCC